MLIYFQQDIYITNKLGKYPIEIFQLIKEKNCGSSTIYQNVLLLLKCNIFQKKK